MAHATIDRVNGGVSRKLVLEDVATAAIFA
jgi:hypothetical protein